MTFLGRRELVQLFNAPLARISSESRANRVFRPLSYLSPKLQTGGVTLIDMAAANWKKRWLTTCSLIHGIMLLAGTYCSLFVLK